MRSNFLLGTLAGIAIGAVVGILMAPDKGVETRRKIGKKGSQYTGDLKDRIGGLKDKYNDVVDGVTSKLESMVGGESGSGSANTAAAGSMAGSQSSGSQSSGSQSTGGSQSSGSKSQGTGNAGTL
ncbi:MAG: YtxH domain-containing protein [Flavobacterium sp.]|nr:YtxH domain-containing protein [Flavobacterium sp.]MBF6608491.1 YtxH domain-containing protein [Flavobacterium sp.]